MNKIILTLAIMTTIGVIQIPSAFAQASSGRSGNPHNSDSRPTGNPHDPSETGNPHDAHGFRRGGMCPGAK